MYVYRYCVYPAILESKSTKNCQIVSPYTGGIQDFKLGGGAHLKKMRRAEGGAKMFGVFRVKKITILRQKIIFFPIFFHFPLFSILRRNHEGTCLYRIQRKV
jgi:hypothetical protein